MHQFPNEKTSETTTIKSKRHYHDNKATTDIKLSHSHLKDTTSLPKQLHQTRNKSPAKKKACSMGQRKTSDTKATEN